MCRVARQYHPPQRPLVAAPSHERKGSRSEGLDAIFGEPHGMCQTIAAARMCDVRINDLAGFFELGHSLTVLVLLDHELEPPQSVRRWPEPSTHRGSLGIAQESKVSGEKQVVHFLWRVAESPQGEVGM